MPKDRFHEYLDYCEQVELIGVGDFVEKFAYREKLAWTQLMRDVWDTYRAGRLLKVIAQNGSAAYVRPEYARLHPSIQNPTQLEGINNGNSKAM